MVPQLTDTQKTMRLNLLSTYVSDGIVCQSILQKGSFNTSVMNNSEHNPKATTVSMYFHGTSIDMFKHIIMKNEEEKGPSLQYSDFRQAVIVPDIPESYLTH